MRDPSAGLLRRLCVIACFVALLCSQLFSKTEKSFIDGGRPTVSLAEHVVACSEASNLGLFWRINRLLLFQCMVGFLVFRDRSPHVAQSCSLPALLNDALGSLMRCDEQFTTVGVFLPFFLPEWEERVSVAATGNTWRGRGGAGDIIGVLSHYSGIPRNLHHIFIIQADQ